MLDSEEAARRLGVKIPTLYSYVSRGLISAERGADGRRIRFRADEVEERARRLRSARHTEIRVATIATGISKLHEDGPSYRGVPAADLAGLSFEEVAELLWASAESGPWCPFTEVSAFGDDWDLAARDRIRLAVVLTGARDPLRADLRREAVVRTGRRLIATAIHSLPLGRNGDGASLTAADEEAPIAARLAMRLGASRVTDELLRAVNAIMILQADHEIAPSTLSVRVAATTRADCYDAVLSGLGSISGPLHGAASDVARKLLEDSDRRGVEQALGDALRWQGSIPGFGHSDYAEGDPRFGILMPFFEALAPASVRRLLRRLLDRTEAQGLPLPNVNLAIGAISYAARLAPDAGETMFTIARMAGWVAHYLEELEHPPRRFRTRTIYAGES